MGFWGARGAARTEGDRSRPRLVCIPSTDDAFQATANHVLDASEAQAPDDLEKELRKRYPRAAVRPRSLEGEPLPTWYVYRDGAFRS